MTVDRWGTDNGGTWALPEKVFYPGPIHIGHSQLRHLISSPSPGIVYSVHGCKVFCLDASTNTRILVTELPFEPICTASGFGYFCAGGEKNGYFATIRIPETPTHGDLVNEQQQQQEEDYPRRSLMLDSLEQLYAGLPPPIRIERLGSLILNSISLHLLHGTGPEKTEDEVVAVLTNNDMTVRIYSLTRDKEIMKEKFEFPMNHATISPNGKLLMIVGDREVAYFYTRIDGGSEIAEGFNGRGGVFQEKLWLPLRVVELYKPHHKCSSAYFTTAWSPNGRICATASEDGAITLLDAASLLDLEQDPFYAMIPSSRPDTAWGAVRTLCFAPDPWDLLIWNEDRGRMCMADIRHGLHVRQVNRMDHHASTVKHAELMEASLLLSDNQGLTDQELQILDGLRTTRQRQEREGSGDTTLSPRSINYIPRRNRMADPAFLSSLREYFRTQNWDGSLSSNMQQLQQPATHSTHSTSSRARSSSHRAVTVDPVEHSSSDPWRIIEAAMHTTGQSAAVDTPITAATSTTAAVNGIQTPASDDDDVSLPPLINANDPPSPRTQSALPDLQEVGDLVAQERQSGHVHPQRSRRLMMAGYRNDVSLREHIASLEAEVGAAEQLLRRNSSSTSPPPPPAADTGPSQREILERRQRLLAIASVSEEVGAERRRRSLREPRTTIMTGGSPPPVTGFSPRRDRDGALTTRSSLTTRGEAVLERQRQLREATEREAQTPSESERQSFTDRSSVLRAFYDRSMQDIRRLEAAGERRRWSRLNQSSADGDSGAWISANPDAGLRTAGIAWGDGRTLYIGTEKGIFELTLDFSERKFWPAIDMR